MLNPRSAGKRQQSAQEFLSNHRDAHRYINQELLCPLTKQVMRYPVIAPDGIAYEKDAIEGYISKQGRVPGSVVPVSRYWRGTVDKSYQEACRPYLPTPTGVAPRAPEHAARTATLSEGGSTSAFPASKCLGAPPASSASERYTAPAWSEACAYQGDSQAGRPHGAGRLTYGPREEFDGHFVVGIPHGEGILRYADGTAVQATWSRGTLADGSQTKVVYGADGFYNGTLVGTLPHGQGRREWLCGDWFDGTWMLGNKHTGTGRSTLNGAMYKGDFLDGVAHGVGTCRWPDNSSYTGDWAHGRREGEGRYVGGRNAYEGSWQGGHRHGHGIHKVGGYTIYEGGWCMNQRSGHGILTDLDGSRYRGTFASNKRHGEGQQVYADGNMFAGHWQHDARQGTGEFVWTNGDIVTGVWGEDHLCEGTGIRHGKAFTHKGSKPCAGLSFLHK